MATDYIRPGVVIDGRVVYPPGWMWILAFALGGCDWAIKRADTPEFRAMVLAELKAKAVADVEAECHYYQEQIDRLRRELHT